jgi:hypothetical protein
MPSGAFTCGTLIAGQKVRVMRAALIFRFGVISGVSPAPDVGVDYARRSEVRQTVFDTGHGRVLLVEPDFGELPPFVA